MRAAKPPYFPFKNQCGLCGCNTGKLYHNWSVGKDETAFAYQMGHVIHAFICDACGAATLYEEVPIISLITRKEDLK